MFKEERVCSSLKPMFLRFFPARAPPQSEGPSNPRFSVIHLASIFASSLLSMLYEFRCNPKPYLKDWQGQGERKGLKEERSWLETGQQRDFPISWEGSTEIRGREDKWGIAGGRSSQGNEQCTR